MERKKIVVGLFIVFLIVLVFIFVLNSNRIGSKENELSNNEVRIRISRELEEEKEFYDSHPEFDENVLFFDIERNDIEENDIEENEN